MRVRAKALTRDLWSFNTVTFLNKLSFSSHIRIVWSSPPEAKLTPVSKHKEYTAFVCSDIIWLHLNEFSDMFHIIIVLSLLPVINLSSDNCTIEVTLLLCSDKVNVNS